MSPTLAPEKPFAEKAGLDDIADHINPGVKDLTADAARHNANADASADKTMVLNMGPQHPSTHGVLRLVVEIDGETVVGLAPDIGYLHTGIEKTCEAKFYQQVVPMTDRIDYLCPMTNNLAYVLAIEKLLQLEIPERAQWIRVLLNELTRLNDRCGRKADASRNRSASFRLRTRASAETSRASSRSTG